MVAFFTLNNAFVIGALAVVTYVGYKDDVFSYSDKSSNEAYFTNTQKTAKAAVASAASKRKAKK